MKRETTKMEVAKYDIAIVYEARDSFGFKWQNHLDLRDIAMGDIQQHLPPGVDYSTHVISMSAKRRPNHQLKQEK
jgi:hypothetical protein